MTKNDKGYEKEALERLQKIVNSHRRALREQFAAGPPEEEEIEPLRLWREQGVWCAVVRGPMALCGYARLPDHHPWIGLSYNDVVPDANPLDEEMLLGEAIDDYGTLTVFGAAFGESLEHFEATLGAQIRVHGGVTWTGPMPIKGAPHGWWIGFDCGHAGDATDPDDPELRRVLAEYTLLEHGHRWTEDEVALEVKRMVEPITQALQTSRTASRTAKEPDAS